MGSVMGTANITVAGCGEFSIRVVTELHHNGYMTMGERREPKFTNGLPDYREIQNSDAVIYIGDGVYCYDINRFKEFIADMAFYPDKFFIFVNRNEGLTPVEKMLQSWQLEELKKMKRYTVINTDDVMEILSFIELFLPSNEEIVVDNRR